MLSITLKRWSRHPYEIKGECATILSHVIYTHSTSNPHINDKPLAEITSAFEIASIHITHTKSIMLITIARKESKFHFKRLIFFVALIMFWPISGCLNSNNLSSLREASEKQLSSIQDSDLRAKWTSLTSSSSWRQKRWLKTYVKTTEYISDITE